jgi:hypothetical protein
MQHLRTCAKSRVSSRALVASKKTINTPLPASTHDWFRLPSIPGRKHQELQTSRSAQYKGFRVWIRNSGSNSLFSGTKTFCVPYSLCGGDDAVARARCERITEHMCQILDKCPIPMREDSTKKLFNSTVIRLATVSAFPNMKKLAYYPTFCLGEGRNISHWSSRICFINAETNAPTSSTAQMRLNVFVGVDPSKIPDVTDSTTFYYGYGHEIIKMKTVNGQQVLPSRVDKRSEHSRTVHNTALKFACWMSSILNDTVTTPERFREIVKSYQTLVGCRDGRRRSSK